MGATRPGRAALALVILALSLTGASGFEGQEFEGRLLSDRWNIGLGTYLVDFSTNGTYVQTEDEQVTHVHRGKLKLWGEGWISLGEPLNLGQPIHYRRA